MMDLFFYLILTTIPIWMYFAYLYGYAKGREDAISDTATRAIIDLSTLSKIPGIEIHGSGIDINTSKMQVDKK
jgi:hypothetical protein